MGDGRFFPKDLANLIRDKSEIKPFDLAILVTAHEEVIGLDWGELSEIANHPIIYDGRRVLDVSSLKSLGWQVYLLGAPI